MAPRSSIKTTFAVGRTLQPIYSGGSIALSKDGRILAACSGEDALLTDLKSGRELARVEGVSRPGPSQTIHMLTSVLGWGAHHRPSSDPLRFASCRLFSVPFHAHIRPHAI